MKRHDRYERVSASEFDHERKQIQRLFEGLPDRAPFRAWSNFTFIDHQKDSNEVDVFLVSPWGVFLIELKAWYGDIAFYDNSWERRSTDGPRSVTTPRHGAQRKAKRLKSLLRNTRAFGGGNNMYNRVPYIQELVIFSQRDAISELRFPQGVPEYLLFLDTWVETPEGLPDALTVLGDRRPGTKSEVDRSALGHKKVTINKEMAKRIARAFDELREAGGAIMEVDTGSRRVGKYELHDELAVNEHFTDYLAFKSSRTSDTKEYRVRVYNQFPVDSPRSRLAHRFFEREASIREECYHQNVLQLVEPIRDHARGPINVFVHNGLPIPLGDWLNGEGDPAQKGKRPTFGERIRVFRQLLEAMEFVHSKRVFHRALSPASLLVQVEDEGMPNVLVHRWMSALHELESTQTLDVAGVLYDELSIYSPPRREGLDGDPELFDVFSIGMLGLRIFTGVDPVPDEQTLNYILSEEGGVRGSNVSNSISKELSDLFYDATRANPAERCRSLSAMKRRFMNEVMPTLVEKPIAAAQPRSLHELVAGDKIGDSASDERFQIISPLGKGSTARAYRVSDTTAPDQNRNFVLKLALKPEHSERLVAEAALLRKLTNGEKPVEGVVELFDELVVEGHAMLVLEDANATLRDQIRQPTLGTRSSKNHPTIETIGSVGRQLIQLVSQLEDRQAYHRDIKPENIGCMKAAGPEPGIELKLFDFSLANTPLTELGVGTERYRDPFLGAASDSRRTWDAAAERWSLAATLYEYVSGTPLRWTEGADPAVVDTIRPMLNLQGRYPDLNELLIVFFERAFERQPDDRYRSSADMLIAWNSIFDGVSEHVAITVNSLTRLFVEKSPEYPLASMDLHPDLVAELADGGFNTVGDLRDDRFGAYVEKNGRSRLKQSIVKEALKQFRVLVRAVTNYKSERESRRSTGARDYSFTPINQIADRLWVSERGTEEQTRANREYLLPTLDGCSEYEQQVRLYDHEVHAENLSGSDGLTWYTGFEDAAERWAKSKQLAPFRADIAELVAGAGGIRSFRSVVHAMRARRGDTERDERKVLLRASGLCRAALAGEGASMRANGERFVADRVGSGSFLYSPNDFALEQWESVRSWIEQLAKVVDARVDAAPVDRTLLYPLLERVAQPDAAPDLSGRSLLDLAVAASSDVAFSARGSVYRRDMAPLNTLRSVVGLIALSDNERSGVVNELQQAARVQFPLAAQLPEGAELSALFEEADIGYRLEPVGGATGYRLSSARSHSTHQSIGSSTVSGSFAEQHQPGYNDALSLLEDAATRGGPYIVNIGDSSGNSQRAVELAQRLAERFEFEAVDLERLTLDMLRDTIREGKPKGWESLWHRVLAMLGDDQPPRGPLRKVLDTAAHRIEAALDDLGPRVVVYRTGVLFELGYDQQVRDWLSGVPRNGSRVAWLVQHANSVSRKEDIGLAGLVEGTCFEKAALNAVMHG